MRCVLHLPRSMCAPRTPGRWGPGARTRAFGLRLAALAALAALGARSVLGAPHSSLVDNSSSWPHTHLCPLVVHAHPWSHLPPWPRALLVAPAPLATRAPVPWVVPGCARCARCVCCARCARRSALGARRAPLESSPHLWLLARGAGLTRSARARPSGTSACAARS